VFINSYKSKDGVFWICTYGGGLNSFDPKTEKFKRYPINSGKDDNFNIENLNDHIMKILMASCG
jgi:streptogramin lyase